MASSAELGWVDKLKHTFNIDALTKKLNLGRASFIEMAVFLAFGFLCGILWKKYSHYMIAGIIFICLLVLLQHLELINVFINWSTVKQFFGIDPVVHGDLMAALWYWIKHHILSVTAFFIGMLIGLKLG